MFTTYFQLGWHHIISWSAIDHLLFLIALSIGASFKQWKNLAVLVTAFTVGHAGSLTAASLGWSPLSSAWIEFLIPSTIALTCLGKLIKNKASWFMYPLTLIFGLIHGLGFSNFLQATLPENFESLPLALFAFNLALEMGQLLVLLVLLVLYALLEAFISSAQKKVDFYINGLAMGMAILLMIQNKPW